MAILIFQKIIFPNMKIIETIKLFLKNLYKKALKINKRVRFGLSVCFLSLLMTFSTFFFFDKAVIFIPLLILGSYLMTYFAVLEGIEKNEWVTLFLIPIALTVSFYTFYFLVPGRWLTRLPFILFYSISIYAVMLSSNIFNVGVEKNLQLYRAAFSINYLFQTIISFFIFNIIFSFKFGFIISASICAVVTAILSVQFFWTQKLKHYWEKEVLLFAVLMGFLVFQLVLVLSFVAINVSILALFVTAFYYSLAGIIYNYLDQRLFKETIREYFFVLGFVFIILLLSINW